MAITRINLRTGLPKARAIFDQLTPGRCEYTAPCVIGAMVSERKRTELEEAHFDDTTISTLISRGTVIAPKGQHEDISRLQTAFDNDTGFDQVFRELEAKYVEQVPA